MGSLSILQMMAFAFSPMVFTIALFAFALWISSRGDSNLGDGPERLLSAAMRHMPPERNEWGEAMMSELMHLHEHGQSFRWCFALGCVRAALFPPATSSWPRYALDAFHRLDSPCALLSIALPTFALPLLWLTSVACNAFTSHDDFFNGELVPGLLGAAIIACLVILFSGVPLGIAGFVRRERRRWLSLLGPVQSLAIFGYMQTVQHLASAGLN